MPDYNVTVTRTVVYSHLIFVEGASDEDDAAKKAVDLAEQWKAQQEPGGKNEQVNDQAGDPITFTEIDSEEFDAEEIQEVDDD